MTNIKRTVLMAEVKNWGNHCGVNGLCDFAEGNKQSDDNCRFLNVQAMLCTNPKCIKQFEKDKANGV